MVPEYLDTLDLRLSAGLVLVDAEKLVEAIEAVYAALRVLIGVSQVDVTRYQDSEESS